MITPSLELYDEHLDRVNAKLKELLEATSVRYGLLIDQSGFIVTHQEAMWAPRPPELDSVAALVAGNAAATRELAKMLGESTFTEQIHQGEKGVLYIESVGGKNLLVLIFDNTVPTNKVRVYAKKTITGLTTILAEIENLPKPEMGTGFATDASALLDDLLG